MPTKTQSLLKLESLRDATTEGQETLDYIDMCIFKLDMEPWIDIGVHQGAMADMMPVSDKMRAAYILASYNFSEGKE